MNFLRLHTTPKAQHDIDKHAFYFAGETLEAGLRFLDAIASVSDELARFPRLGVEFGSESSLLQDLRAWPVPGFANWLIFYQLREENITLLRVLHRAQDIPTALTR